jgi:hypothetical protein
VKKSASLLALLTLTLLPEISKKTIAAKVLVVFTAIRKPRLTALEVHHRLVSIEGQKEIARRLKAVQKTQEWR